MHTKDAIVEMLRTRDVAVAKALVALLNNQTADEQASEDTIHQNGKGFVPCDAFIGTEMAKFYIRNGYLTEKQLSYWRKPMKNDKMRIEKYAGQLLRGIAQKNF